MHWISANQCPGMTSPAVSGYRLAIRECGTSSDALSSEQTVCDYVMTPNGCQDRNSLVMTHQAGNNHFETTWAALKTGFNDEEAGEYYIGNDALYHILGNDGFSLRIDMWSTDGDHITAEYSDVTMTASFALSLGAYHRGTATAGGLVTYHSGSAFSTQDVDSSGCTSEHPSAWWYLRNRAVSFPSGSSTECFTSQLTSATNMTWALEDNDGVITGQVPINKVVMQLLGETVAGKTFFVDILT